MILRKDQLAQFRLLAPDRKLPESATDVRVYYRKFQDSALLVRFDAPTADARSFSESLIGRSLVPGEDPRLHKRKDLDWWLEGYPAGAEGGEYRIADGRPSVQIVLVPRGSTARVWLHTFTV